MNRLVAAALALGCAGCTRGVRVEEVTFGPRDQGHLQLVAKLDTDLRDLEYFMSFKYAVRADRAAPSDHQMKSVDYMGRFHGTESFSRSLSERRGGAVSEGPSRVRIYLPWPEDHESGRFLFLRLGGSRPYSSFRIESNTVVAELPP